MYTKYIGVVPRPTHMEDFEPEVAILGRYERTYLNLGKMMLSSSPPLFGATKFSTFIQHFYSLPQTDTRLLAIEYIVERPYIYHISIYLYSSGNALMVLHPVPLSTTFYRLFTGCSCTASLLAIGYIVERTYISYINIIQGEQSSTSLRWAAKRSV